MCISSTLLPILLISLGAVYVPIDAASFRCYEGSFTKYRDYGLDPANLTALRNSLNASKGTLCPTGGYNHNMSGEYMEIVVTESLRLAFNVIAMNWENEASSGSTVVGVIAGYPLAYTNVEIVGKQYGQAFCEGDIPVDCIIGHSLGAHVASATAKEMKRRGRLLPQIIALDPARPAYDQLPIIGLSSNDALHTMCVNTNPGGLGTIYGRCHTNVWVSCGNRVQPACATAGGWIDSSGQEDSCSHNFCWRITVDGSQNPGSYVARLAPTCADWRAGQGSNVTLPLGINVDTTLTGNFYLRTSNTAPFGLGQAGSNP